jgi:hypothetical protein
MLEISKNYFFQIKKNIVKENSEYLRMGERPQYFRGSYGQ